MKKQFIFSMGIVLSLLSSTLSAQVLPRPGQAAVLEIANWNIAWFGKTAAGYGPSNDSLQQALVLQVIQEADIDIWGLTEVADSLAFKKMMQQLPAYQGVLADYFPEQKTACIFKTDQFTLISSKLLGKKEKDSFSTGRYPLELVLKPKQNIGIDTLYLIVLHLKAHIGNDSSKMLAYNSRRRSAEWIDWKIKSTYSKTYCMFFGDWNDDVDRSIFNQLPSPFVNLEQSFFFTSRLLSNSNQGTTTSYPDAVDHQLISPALKLHYMPDSTFVWRLDQYINQYASTCSDHYPVYSFFNLYSSQLNTLSAPGKPRLITFENSQEIGFTPHTDAGKLQLFSLSGQALRDEYIPAGGRVSLKGLAPGVYTVKLEYNNSAFHYLLRIGL